MRKRTLQSYGARGKFGGQERSARVAESNCIFITLPKESKVITDSIRKSFQQDLC